MARWANVSGNLGYNWNSSIKGDFPGGRFTLLDRPDELMISGALDFPINRYFQPIVEVRQLKYMGGRTPNAFENDPTDIIGGVRFYPARWWSFGLGYRYHANQQDEDIFDDENAFTNNAFVSCAAVGTTGGCVPRVVSSTTAGVPLGFRLSDNPHGYFLQATVGRRNPRQGPIVNIPANVTALSVSDTEITLPCPAGTIPRQGVTCADATTVNVTTTAVDVENDVLTYNYTVSGGRIVGTGANVQWDLSGVQEGSYTITAAVDDGCGLCGQTRTETVRVVRCVDCVNPCECWTIDVSGPVGVTQPGDTMTFTANVTGGTATGITYNWTVSSGTIESGQGTPSITVRTSRAMANTTVTATVDVGGTGVCPECPRGDSASAGVAGFPESQLVDEFGALSADDIRGRLDSFFAELSNNPTNQGYIIIYGTEREMTTRERLIRNHITFRGFDPNRITIVRGGTHPSGTVYTRMYRVPPGAENPTP